MVDPVEDVKQRARLLHRAATRGNDAALVRLRGLLEFRQADPGTLMRGVQRRHCLAALARELGFYGWPHAKAVLGGERVADFGSLMHAGQEGGYPNIWSASYAEARSIRAAHGGYLLPYRRHFLIVEAYYIEQLGLDSHSPDWERMGRDWPRPRDRQAWLRVTSAAVAARLERSARVGWRQVR